MISQISVNCIGQTSELMFLLETHKKSTQAVSVH